MGQKGDKSTQPGNQASEIIFRKLSVIDGVTIKSMFGGHGIFHDGQMFGIVDSKGQSFLKTDASNKDEFEKAGSHQHSRMPYYSIPESVLENEEDLILWARKSMSINSSKG